MYALKNRIERNSKINISQKIDLALGFDDWIQSFSAVIWSQLSP